MLVEAGQARRDNAKDSHLRVGKVDEGDSPPQDFDPQRYVGGEHQQAGGKRRCQHAKVDAMQFGIPGFCLWPGPIRPSRRHKAGHSRICDPVLLPLPVTRTRRHPAVKVERMCPLTAAVAKF